MSLPFRSTGNTRSWQFDRRPMDSSLRLRTHGKVLPMDEEPGFLRRLFRRAR